MAHFAKITPLGRSAFVVRLDSSPQWKVSEVGGWKDGTATCYIPPARRLWLSGAACEIAGPFGPHHMGFVRTYDGDTLSIEGHHDAAMMGEPTLGKFCSNSLSEWRPDTLLSDNKDIALAVAGIEGTSEVALTATWQTNGDTNFPNTSYAGWVLDFGETVPDAWISLTRAVPSVNFRVKVYALQESFVGGELTRGALVLDANTNGTSEGVSLGSCRAVLIQAWCGSAIAWSNTNVYTTVISAVRAYTVVAPRYDASDGKTALRASDVAEYLFGTAPAWMVGGLDISDDLTVCEPFSIEGTAADQLAALLNVSDASAYWESRGPGMPWGVYRARAELPVIDLPAEDGSRVTCNIAPADISGMASAVRVFYTDSTGTRRHHTAYDTDKSHYLVQIGRYHDPDPLVTTYGPVWGPALDCGEGTADMAAQAASTFFAYTTHGVDGPAPWTGSIVTANCLPDDYRPGCVLRCRSQDYGRISARARESAHTPTTATLTLDNTATASDMVARAVEGLNRSRAYTAARAIKTKTLASLAVRQAIAKKLKAAKSKKK